MTSRKSYDKTVRAIILKYFELFTLGIRGLIKGKGISANVGISEKTNFYLITVDCKKQ